MQKLVSVVVSVFNVEEFLPKCLESLSIQTYRNLEILLIDDGSTDGSGKICDDFAAHDPRARVIHQENQGPWGARNRGQIEAQGDYLVFPDGDDYFHKDYIRLLFEAINYDGKEYPMAICGFQGASDANKDIISNVVPCFEIQDQSQLMKGLFCHYIGKEEIVLGANWNKMYRKSILPIPFQRSFPRCQDLDSNIRIYFSIDHAVRVKNDLYYWFSRPGSLTRSKEDIPLRNACRSQIFYDNYLALPDNLKKYRHYLLTALFIRLILWKEFSKGTNQQTESLAKIKEYERKTLLAFLLCRNESLFYKLHLLFLLHCPKTTRYLKRIASVLP